MKCTSSAKALLNIRKEQGIQDSKRRPKPLSVGVGDLHIASQAPCTQLKNDAIVRISLTRWRYCWLKRIDHIRREMLKFVNRECLEYLFKQNNSQMQLIEILEKLQHLTNSHFWFLEGLLELGDLWTDLSLEIFFRRELCCVHKHCLVRGEKRKGDTVGSMLERWACSRHKIPHSTRAFCSTVEPRYYDFERTGTKKKYYFGKHENQESWETWVFYD